MGETFSFGRNWQDFLRTMNDGRLKIAEDSITDFMSVKDLSGKSFLDIGCGSGLFSQAAFELNAKRIVSFDYDPFSVECCKHLKVKSGSPGNWEILEGSILDKAFISRLGKFDIVYSWGVLHHTGHMWEAIRDAAGMVDKGGWFYIAIYNKTFGPMGSDFWLKEKKLYNSLPAVGKKSMEMAYIMAMIGKNAARMKSPLTGIRDSNPTRGMNWRTDITDWLGGYPYESATIEEIASFMRTNFPGFSLINIKRTASAMGNNWFLFKNGEI